MERHLRLFCVLLSAVHRSGLRELYWHFCLSRVFGFSQIAANKNADYRGSVFFKLIHSIMQIGVFRANT